jgi:hypothetical protein
MQKSGKSVWAFPFLKSGPVQTRQGPLGAGPAGSLRLIAASMGPGFQDGTRKLANWDPQLITAIYWALSFETRQFPAIAIPELAQLPIIGGNSGNGTRPISNWG